MTDAWIEKKLIDVATLQRGFDLPHRARKPGDNPIVTSSGIEHTHAEAKAWAPGVVTGRYGSIGDVFYLEKNFWPLNTTLYVKDFHGNAPLFIYYLLRTVDFATHSGKSGVPGVNRNDLHQESVAIPPTQTEQQAIAEALSDADALIESLEQLIAKKRQIKQGAMQQLLTGRKRLPGFNKAWGNLSLDQIADIRSGGTPSTLNREFWDGEIAWCTPTDITALRGRKYLLKTQRTITDAGLRASSAEIIPPQSIIMTTRATIGECAINTRPITTNQGFKNLIPFAADAEFLYYLMTTQKDRLIQLCGGSTFLEIGTRQLRQFELTLPTDRGEQTAIAEILSDMDAEITELETKLAKGRQVKQGMMQQLLTGRIRLVESEAAA